MQFSRELRPGVASGHITVSVRLWRTPKVRAGGRYVVGQSIIEIGDLVGLHTTMSGRHEPCPALGSREQG